MTRDQVKDIQLSFRTIVTFRDYAAATFYERLFEIDPATRRLFAGTDLRVAGERLVASLGVIVECLRRPDGLSEARAAKAIRGFSQGVHQQHFASLGKALMATLETILGHDWTHELWIAWAAAYAVITRAMNRIAQEAPQGA